MRILIFNWRDPKHSWAGGGEIYIFQQASRWVKMGHEVTVFCGEDIEKKLPSFEILNGIKIYRKGGRYTLYLWAVWYYFTRFLGKIDVVIDVENGIPFFTPLFCKVPKVCFVYHIHGNQFFYELSPPFSHIGYFIEKYVFPRIYRHISIVAISKTTKKQLLKNGFRSKNISIIYCGMEKPQKIIKGKVKKYSNPTILYLGRIKRYKRVDLLVDIFPQILSQVPKARLIIAGWGTEASYLADIIMKSPIRRKISLLGPVTNAEKKSLLSKSWVFVNPSIGEGWGMAVIEANLNGAPAVSFRVTGLSESIKHGKTGLLARDKKDFIKKIILIISEARLREKLSANAQQRAKAYDWDKTSQKSIRLLQKAIRRK